MVYLVVSEHSAGFRLKVARTGSKLMAHEGYILKTCVTHCSRDENSIGYMNVWNSVYVHYLIYL